jgi:hypothetical protein
MSWTRFLCIMYPVRRWSWKARMHKADGTEKRRYSAFSIDQGLVVRTMGIPNGPFPPIRSSPCTLRSTASRSAGGPGTTCTALELNSFGCARLQSRCSIAHLRITSVSLDPDLGLSSQMCQLWPLQSRILRPSSFAVG